MTTGRRALRSEGHRACRSARRTPSSSFEGRDRAQRGKFGRGGACARGGDRRSTLIPRMPMRSRCRIYQPVLGLLQNPDKYLAVTKAGVAAVPSSTLLPKFPRLRAARHRSIHRRGSSVRIVREIAPREPNPYDSLGEAHILMGPPEKALEYFSTGAHNPTDFLSFARRP